MKIFRPFLALVTGLLAMVSLNARANVTYVVAASAVPHAEILEVIKPLLAKEGIDLKVRVFNDYVQPNLVLEDKEVNANFFQHVPYLTAFNKDHGTHIVYVGNVHVEPFGGYSHRYKSVSQLPNNALVALPNDPANEARALLLLQNQGLVRLKDPKNLFSTPDDVVYNPKHLKFKAVDAALLPRILDDVDLALINTNYALQAGLNPVKDALFIEGAQSPYANGLCVLDGQQNDPVTLKVLKALQSPEVKAFILKQYKGAIVPAF